MYKNLALIEGTDLTVHEHFGRLIIALSVNYNDGGMQTIYTPVLSDKGNLPTAYGCDMIMSVMDAVGVSKWEKLVGQTIYVLSSEPMELGDDGRNIIGIEGVFGGSTLLWDDVYERNN